MPRPDELPDAVLDRLRAVDPAVDPDPQRDRRVQVRAVEIPDGVDGEHHRHAPPEGDHDPSRVLSLRLGQQHPRHNAVAEQNQQRGTDDLGRNDAQCWEMYGDYDCR